MQLFGTWSWVKISVSMELNVTYYAFLFKSCRKLLITAAKYPRYNYYAVEVKSYLYYVFGENLCGPTQKIFSSYAPACMFSVVSDMSIV